MSLDSLLPWMAPGYVHGWACNGMYHSLVVVEGLHVITALLFEVVCERVF